MRVVLCIDDEPIRYRNLAKQLPNDIVLITTHSLQDVKFYLELPQLYQIVGICLDCDMPNGPQGFYYASHILNEKNIPVVIASQNSSEALKCHEILDEYATPNILLPVMDDEGWIKMVIDFFKVG